MITRSQYLEKSFKQLPPDIPALAKEVALATSTPIEFAVLAILVVLSAVYQSRATVKSPSGQVSSLGLFALIIGDPSSGKTQVFKLLMRSLVRFYAQCRDEYKDALKLHKAGMRVWQSKLNALERRLKVLDGKGSSTEEIEEQIKALTEPDPPQMKWLLGSDVSVSALVDYYRGTGKSAMIASEEASRFFKSPLFQKDDDFLNSLYSMEIPGKHRLHMHVDANEPFMAMLLLIQQKAFDKHVGKRLTELEGTVFVDRLLVTSDEDFESEGEIDVNHLPLTDAFNEHIWKALNQPETERKVYELESHAHATFNIFRAAMHRDSKPGGPLADMKGAAKRRVENSVKVACILHCYYEREGLISDSLYKPAKDLIVHFLFEHQRIFASEENLPGPMRYGRELEEFIRRRIAAGDASYLNAPLQWQDLSWRSHIYGQNFKDGVSFLCGQGKARVDRNPGPFGRPANFITLTRGYFDGSSSRWDQPSKWLAESQAPDLSLNEGPHLARAFKRPDRY